MPACLPDFVHGRPPAQELSLAHEQPRSEQAAAGVFPAVTQVPLLQSVPGEHASPAQHASPAPPQASHVPGWLPLHKLPARQSGRPEEAGQHGSALPPHGTHT